METTYSSKPMTLPRQHTILESLGLRPVPVPGARRWGQDDEALRRLERLARLLDSWIRIPGSGVSIGLDGFLGLVPGFGDALGALLSAYIVHEARELGAPPSLLVRMCGNIVVDTLVGMVPIFGDLFDVAFKANQKNVALLSDWLNREREKSWAGR